MTIDAYNTFNNKDTFMNSIRKLVVTILSLLLFNTAVANTEDPFDKDINKNNFVVDELLVLEKMPSLPTALPESRKYGGCFAAGLQNN